MEAHFRSPLAQRACRLFLFPLTVLPFVRFNVPDNSVASRAGSLAETAHMQIARASHSSTLLPDGKVLVAGGEDRSSNALTSAELYDPASGKFTRTGDMTEPRGEATATALRNGKILIVGGGSGPYPSQTVYRSAELYDPATGKFALTGQMTVGRHKHAAVLLASGKVLVVGGSDNRDCMVSIRARKSMTLLPAGLEPPLI